MHAASTQPHRQHARAYTDMLTGRTHACHTHKHTHENVEKKGEQIKKNNYNK